MNNLINTDFEIKIHDMTESAIERGPHVYAPFKPTHSDNLSKQQVYEFLPIYFFTAFEIGTKMNN